MQATSSPPHRCTGDIERWKSRQPCELLAGVRQIFWGREGRQHGGRVGERLTRPHRAHHHRQAARTTERDQRLGCSCRRVNRRVLAVAITPICRQPQKELGIDLGTRSESCQIKCALVSIDRWRGFTRGRAQWRSQRSRAPSDQRTNRNARSCHLDMRGQPRPRGGDRDGRGLHSGRFRTGCCRVGGKQLDPSSMTSAST